MSRPPRPTGLARHLPAIDATRTYRRAFLRPDVLAGLTAWAMVVPEGIGYASIAGMPAEAALYAAVLGTAAYFLFGTSHEVTVGPSSALAIMSAATVGSLGLGANSADWIAATSALAIIVGIMALVAGVLKLGTINNFISKPVLDGFVAGLALNIIIGQVPKFLGFGIDGDLNFFQSVAEVVANIDQTSMITFAMGAGSYLLLMVLHRISKRIPAALIAVAASVVAVVVFNLDDRGIAVIGEIPSGFPTIDIPSVDLGMVGQLLPGALGMMVVAYAETLSGGRTFAARRQYRIDPDQEFIALGWSNIAAGLFQGFAVNGSLSRTKLKYDVGVKTQYSTLFTGVAVAITLVALTWFFERLAEATIAAIVIHAVFPLVRPRLWPQLWRTARFEFWAALSAALVTMVLGEVQGLFFGVVVAVFMVTARAAQAPVAELGHSAASDAWVELGTVDDAERVPGVLILDAGAPPSFANAAGFHDAIVEAVYDADPSPDVVVLDFDVVTSIDVTTAASLGQLMDELSALDVELHLARVRPEVLAELREQELATATRAGRVHATVRDAVDTARAPAVGE
nr:SulP family inorganic anion transporter [Salsipaludibacter albus]